MRKVHVVYLVILIALNSWYHLVLNRYNGFEYHCSKRGKWTHFGVICIRSLLWLAMMIYVRSLISNIY